MKTLNQYIRESILSNEKELIDDDNSILVDQFLKDNYKIDGTYTIENGAINVNGDLYVKNKNLKDFTVPGFKFGKVNGSVYCVHIKGIETLKGAPEEVTGSFMCSNCDNLRTLRGAPKKVGQRFWCDHNEKLSSLIGSPDKVKKFSCVGCNKLKNLKGSPRTVEEEFNCSQCRRLSSLEGCPDYVGKHFVCDHCPKLVDTELAYKVTKGKVTV